MMRGVPNDPKDPGGGAAAAAPTPGDEPVPPWRARVVAWGERLARQPHLGSVRDGVVGALPLILLGSLFLLLAQPPWPSLARWLPPPDALKAAWRACAGLVSIYACAATALALARRREADPAASVTTALAMLFLAQHPAPLAAGGLGLPLPALGAAGLFPAFAAALLAVEVLAFFQRRRWGIRLAGGAPDVVVRSFAALLPSTLCTVSVWAAVHLAGWDLAGGLGRLFAPLVSASDALPALWAIVLIDSGLWMIGVHGLSVLAAVRPLWLAALSENMQAALSGQAPTHLATQEFFVWFVWQGGSGTTLALAFWLLFARSQQLRLVGRAGLLPALFNINEPLLFGVPVVLNGQLAVPFVLSPVLLCTTTWFAMRSGWLQAPIAEVVWTLPAPVGAFLCTGGALRAVILQMGNLILAVLLWWPFVRRYDRALAAAEARAKA
jgi:PTS system cellobiose-specific IIC component